MTRLIWDISRTRTYETGIDRCVLYTSGQPGVAWTGVMRMQEIHSGLDVTSNYFDGQKYRTAVGKGDFKARLTAFSSPKEFAPCEGALEIGDGLFAMRQPKEMFGLCYRTLIGNDTEGTDYGYKIHLVYNILAIPSPVVRTTLSADPTPTEKEWNLSTVPYREREFAYFRSGGDQTEIDQQKTVYKPTSHMVVDTRAVGPAKITHLENVLYGTELTQPELPTPSELLEIIS